MRVTVGNSQAEGHVVFIGGQRLSRVEPFQSEQDFQACLARVLDITPRIVRPFVKPGIRVAPPRVISRIVRGLPLTKDTKLLSRVVKATPERYFLAARDGIIVGDVDSVEPGVVRASAYETSFVAAVSQACRAGQFRGATVLSSVPGYSDTSLQVSTVPARASRAVWTVRAVAGLAILGLAWAIVPVASARARAERDTEYLGTVSEATQRIGRISDNLDAMTAPLLDLESFERSRSSAVGLLQDLSGSLPDSALVTSLSFVDGRVAMTVLSPNAGSVTQRLADIPGATRASIIGPVTRELVSGRDQERVTIRFEYSPPQSRWRQPLTMSTRRPE